MAQRRKVSLQQPGGVATASAGYDRLISDFRDPLIKFFRRRTGDAIAAEDLAHDVILRAVARPDYGQVRNPDAFVFTIAVNLLRDNARSAKNRPFVSLDQTDPRNLVEDLDPERVLIAKDLLARVTAALGELNERTRDMFLLYRFEKLKQREIARRFGVSVSAVEKQIVKAMVHLARRGFV